MKPHILQAQAKELYNYIKSVNEIDKKCLLEINKKTIKLLLEVSENLEKI